MAVVAREVAASCEQVWATLSDGWLYPAWVVGASRIRGVDPSWPAVGARLHHSVGLWPLLLDDNTEVREADPGRRLLLRARGWPMGEADVDLRLEPGAAQAGRCRVVMTEKAVSGPGILGNNPVSDQLLAMRNRETLRRLAALAEGRAR